MKPTIETVRIPAGWELRVETFPIARWIGLAVIARVLSVFTHASYGHPDEWFQTVELGNYLAHGFASWTEAFSFHFRNLTWPSLIAGILQLADAVDPASVATRELAVRGLSLFFDLSTLGWIIRTVERSDLGARTQKWALGLFILPWFLIQDSNRPSMEHLSQIALWWTLGAVSIEAWWLAGFSVVLSGVLRYPSLLFAVGLTIWIFSTPHSHRARVRYWIGMVSAILAGGLADALTYGRPYESLWMYAQYNLFAGMGAKYYGQQSILTYFPYFWGHWGGVLAPVGVLLLALAPVGLTYGLYRKKAWSFLAITYLAGHLLIGHKEPRFMIPFEPLFVLSGLTGAQWVWNSSGSIRTRWAGSARWKFLAQGLSVVTMLILLGNGLLSARAAVGDFGRSNATYFEIDRQLADHVGACAVVTVRRPIGTLLPWKNPEHAPEPALGFFPAKGHSLVDPEQGEIAQRPLIWISHRPHCREGDTVLLHLTKPTPYWSQLPGCELLASGILRWFDRPIWNRLIEKNLAGGSWYYCPASALQNFQNQQVRNVIAKSIPHWEELPPLGTDAEGLEKLGHLKTETGVVDGTFSDW